MGSEAPSRTGLRSATADAFYTVPSGFRPYSSTAYGVAHTANAANFNRIQVTAGGVASVWAYNTHAAGTLTYLDMMWHTQDAWPASLPG